jgi:hypothetical protein
MKKIKSEDIDAVAKMLGLEGMPVIHLDKVREMNEIEKHHLFQVAVSAAIAVCDYSCPDVLDEEHFKKNYDAAYQASFGIFSTQMKEESAKTMAKYVAALYCVDPDAEFTSN